MCDGTFCKAATVADVARGCACDGKNAVDELSSALFSSKDGKTTLLPSSRPWIQPLRTNPTDGHHSTARDESGSSRFGGPEAEVMIPTVDSYGRHPTIRTTRPVVRCTSRSDAHDLGCVLDQSWPRKKKANYATGWLSTIADSKYNDSALSGPSCLQLGGGISNVGASHQGSRTWCEH